MTAAGPDCFVFLTCYSMSRTPLAIHRSLVPACTSRRTVFASCLFHQLSHLQLRWQLPHDQHSPQKCLRFSVVANTTTSRASLHVSLHHLRLSPLSPPSLSAPLRPPGLRLRRFRVATCGLGCHVMNTASAWMPCFIKAFRSRRIREEPGRQPSRDQAQA